AARQRPRDEARTRANGSQSRRDRSEERHAGRESAAGEDRGRDDGGYGGRWQRVRRVPPHGRSDRGCGDRSRGPERDRQRAPRRWAQRHVPRRGRGEVPSAGRQREVRRGWRRDAHERGRRRTRGAEEEDSNRLMTRRLVVCLRWRPGDEDVGADAFAEAASAIVERLATLGGRLILWHPEWLCVDFGVDGLQDAIDFIVDHPDARFSTGFAYGTLHEVVDGGPTLA